MFDSKGSKDYIIDLKLNDYKNFVGSLSEAAFDSKNLRILNVQT